MTRSARVDAMMLALILSLEREPKRTPAWRTPVGEKRSRPQAKKRKAKRKVAKKSRRGKRK